MRVNIEDDAWNDSRFVLLQALWGVEDYVAYGAMAKVWKYCQDNHTEFIHEAELNILIRDRRRAKSKSVATLFQEVELVVPTSDAKLYRVKGMADRLKQIDEYIENRIKSGKLGGLKSAEIRRSRQSKIQASAKRDLEVTYKVTSKVTSRSDQASTKGLSLGLMSSSEEKIQNTGDLNSFVEAPDFDANAPTVSADAEPGLSQIFEADVVESNKAKSRPRKKPKGSTTAVEVIPSQKTASKEFKEASWSSKAYDFWREQYRMTYRAEPGDWSGAEWNCLKQLYGKAEKDIDKLCILIEHYFQRRDYAFTQSGHSVMKILPSFHRLWAEVQNGRKLTDRDIRRASSTEATTQDLNDFLPGMARGLSFDEALDERVREVKEEEALLRQSANASKLLEKGS